MGKGKPIKLLEEEGREEVEGQEEEGRGEGEKVEGGKR